jgi:hypothetical protein
MLDTKIAGARENVDSVGMEFAYGKCKVKRPEWKRQAAVRAEKGDFLN